MEIDNYPSNSNFELKAPKKEKPKAEKIITGKAKKGNEKSFLRQVSDAFFDTEDIPDIKHYVVFEVMIPGAKRMILESIESFFGVRSGTFSSAFGGKGYTKYNKTPASKINDGSANKQRRATYEYPEVLFCDYHDADCVLSQLCADLEEYGIVSVNDYYDYSGETGTAQDCKYGWTDLRQARVERTTEGYIIRMPKALPIN